MYSSKALFLGIFFGLIFLFKFILVLQTKQTRALLRRPILFFLYQFTWLGTYPENFLKKHKFTQKDAFLMVQGASSIVFGLVIQWSVRRYFLELDNLASYLSIFSLIYIWGFGYSNLMCGLYRLFEIGVEPIFQNPLESTSLQDFWGKRWNTALINLSQRLLYNPLKNIFSPGWLQIFVFLIFGLIHDLIFSFPIDAGYGKCTAYFAIQGLALVSENKFLSKFFNKHPDLGNIWTFLVLLIPLPLLFHWDFREFILSRFVFHI